ncbi:MAG TPA: dTMP kinase [Caldithrix abyssi]|uniref:Thymidylate kinase n=1 Tax=Caldithrix abyssi TaxID=187145 RepID=A0A7V4WU24_CALAY|nr:dTMP kinase [Caldithrix abyssi]
MEQKIADIDRQHFISFEGIDYSGKTTQINLLQAFLQKKGYSVYVLREPGGTVISEKIRDILLDRNHHEMSERAEIFLYSAARVQLVSEKIIPLLKEGYFIIADRYVDSTTAYQGYGRGLDLEMVKQINSAATFGLMPSITFYMEITPEQAQQRRLESGAGADRLEGAGIDFYQRVFNGYKELIRKEPDRFRVINAMQSVNSIHKKIIDLLEDHL